MNSSASVALKGTGETEPTPTLKLFPLSSTNRARDTTEITIAFRIPTFKNSCGPSSRGSLTDSIISPACKAFDFTPVTNSSTEISRCPVDDLRFKIAFIATNTGIVSPAGDAVARLPPKVPALRICGEPTVLEACARAGRIEASSGFDKSEYEIPEPKTISLSFMVHSFNSDIRVKSTTFSRELAPLFTCTIKSVPPASTVVSGFSASSAHASFTDLATITPIY